MTQKEVERKLPDEQNKLDEEADDNFMQTMERANELSKQYEEIKDRTLGNGLVAGKLEDIDTSPANNNIIVTVDLPGEGNVKQFRFKKPKVWSEKYKFVRWIHYYGYDADSFPNMLKSDCEVEVENMGGEEYSLFVPERKESIKETASTIKVKMANVFDLYRESNNNLYISHISGVMYTICILLWITPMINYGLHWVTAISLACVGYIILLVFGIVEDGLIKNQ